VILAVLLLAAIHSPEECLVTRGGKAAVTVEHNGKRYAFRHADCRDEFLTDPERYSQLYDTLLELHAQGAKIESAPPSLVPS
jgi:YHS domain-containing protein